MFGLQLMAPLTILSCSARKLPALSLALGYEALRTSYAGSVKLCFPWPAMDDYCAISAHVQQHLLLMMHSTHLIDLVSYVSTCAMAYGSMCCHVLHPPAVIPVHASSDYLARSSQQFQRSNLMGLTMSNMEPGSSVLW